MTFSYDFSNLTVEKIKNTTQEIIDSEMKLTTELLNLNDELLTWDNFIKPTIDLDIINTQKAMIIEMSSFHTDFEIRKTCSDCENELCKFSIEQAMRRDYFAKFKKYYEKYNQDSNVKNNSERIKYLEEVMKKYKLGGLDLPDEQYEQVKQIKTEISRLTNTFSLNLNNENTVLYFKKEELIGLPDSFLDKRKQNDDTYKITLKYPDYIPIMEYCDIETTREKMARHFLNRCYPVNMELCIETFKLRNKLANLLGFKQFSDMILVNRMAKNTETVMNFLNDLMNKIKPLSSRDIKILEKIKGSEIKPSDIQYYSRIYEQKECDLDDENLRQYFPLKTVINGMFEIYQTILNYKFIDVTDQYKNRFWHEDVELYQVIDNDTQKIKGYFALDLFPREGKYGHAAVFPFIGNSTNTIPFCVMACNFEKNNGLRFAEVETFFHEFGHVMHGISSDTELLYFSGTRCERDFVEAPSQMLEEWCFSPIPLKMMSENLTDEIIIKLNKRKHLLQGYHYARQLSFCFYDMYVHSDKINYILNDIDQNDIGLNLRNLLNSINLDTVGIPQLDNTNFGASFAHIMGGYEAGYYGYLWSQVYAKDMFNSKFLNNELNKNNGMLYRKEILSFGGSRDSMESLKLFLGREPSNEAFINSID